MAQKEKLLQSTSVITNFKGPGSCPRNNRVREITKVTYRRDPFAGVAGNSVPDTIAFVGVVFSDPLEQAFFAKEAHFFIRAHPMGVFGLPAVSADFELLTAVPRYRPGFRSRLLV